MKRFVYFPVIAFLLSFFSCSEFKPCEFTGIEGARIITMANNEAEVELNVKIKNPNDFGFTIYPSDFDVTLGAADIGKARLKNRVHIKANAEIIYRFIVKTDMSKIVVGGITSIFSILQKNNVPVSVKGELKAGRIFYRKISRGF